MKKLLSVLLIFSMLLALVTVISGCNGEETLNTLLDKSMEVSESAIDEYAEEVKNATSEDKEELKQRGDELLKNLDDIDKDLDEADDDISEETKNKIANKTSSLRQKINEALATLETK